MPDTPIYVSDDEVNPKTRLGQKKPSITAIPPTALFHLAMAMMDGERKYGLHNWKEKDVPARIYIDAAVRHLLAWADGEEIADDSKCHHVAHAMACCCIILDAMEQGCLIDDRSIPGKTSEVLKRLQRQLEGKPTLQPNPATGGVLIVNNEVDQ